MLLIAQMLKTAQISIGPRKMHEVITQVQLMAKFLLHFLCTKTSSDNGRTLLQEEILMSTLIPIIHKYSLKILKLKYYFISPNI